MIGRRIGRYLITRQIGRGGMGAVFEAVHENIGQRLAVKVLHPMYAAQAAILARFFNEARAVNIIKHPGLVQIFDCDQLPDGVTYITMEFLEGESLRARIQRQADSVLPLMEALNLTSQIAAALQVAHDRGIVHRDLKPDNIFVVPDPLAPLGQRAKVLDFGVAKMRAAANLSDRSPLDVGETGSDAILGTPAYMAPEQCRSAGDVDDRADVYSLGVILYQMLAGRTPFVGQSSVDLLYMQLNQEPPPLRQYASGVADELAKLVHLMLRKDAASRPTMKQVIAELARLYPDLARLAPRPPAEMTSAGEGSIPSQALSMGRVKERRRLGWTLWWGVPGVLIITGTLVWFLKEGPPQQAKPAVPIVVSCQLSSEPSGARVLRTADRVQLGTTPWSMTLGEQPDIVLQFPGFAERRVKVSTGTGCPGRLILERLAAHAPAQPTHEPAREEQHKASADTSKRARSPSHRKSFDDHQPKPQLR